MDFTDSFKDYMKRIRKARLLTADEERALASRAAQGDQAARARMIEANLRLVVSVAKRYRNCGLPYPDLIQEGNEGLITAADKYDPAKGRFSTYASYWIRQSMSRAIYDKACTVRLPVHVAEQQRRLYKRRIELAANGDALPDAAALAADGEYTEAQVERLLHLDGNALSLDREYEDGDKGLHDRLASEAPSPYEAAEASQRAAHVKGWLSGLKEKERVVIERRFGFDGLGPKTLEETAQGLNVTRERVRQIEGNALKKLRRCARFMNAWRA